MAAAAQSGLTLTFKAGPTMQKVWPMKDKEIILSGPAGTGKTRFWLERQHRIMTKYPKARGIIIRKYRSSMGQTCLKTWENEVLREDLGTLVRWIERDQTYYYKDTGGEVAVAGMDDPTKILSSQWDWVYWNEVIEGKLAEWETITTRLRNYAVPYQQIIGDTNPGPPTHWIKQRGNKNILKLIETTHRDNPRYWDADKGYWTQEGLDYVVGTLANLSGIRRKRLFEGKWEAAEGQVYPMFDPEVHVVKWFKPSASWPRYWVFDFGFIDPLVWQHWTEDPDSGDLYLVQELYKTHLRVSDAAEWVLRESKGHPYPRAIICDHDAENRMDLEHAFKMLTVPAYKAIHPGIQGVQNRLLNSVHKHQVKKEGKDPTRDPKYNRPGVYFMEGCGITEDEELRARYHPLGIVQELDAYCWDIGKMAQDQYKDLPIDKFNHGCLVGSTNVTTDNGTKRLDQVCAGDRVLTRGGYQRVLISAKTGISKPVVRLTLLDGRTVDGTGDHPILCSDGEFRPMDTLRYGMLVVCEWKSLPFVASSSDDILSQRTARTGRTSSQQFTSRWRESVDYMKKFGKRNMERFQMGAKSIIGTETRSITDCPIWPVSRLKTIGSGTESILGKLRARLWNIWNVFGQWRWRGISPQRDGNGTGNMQPKLPETESLKYGYANSVGESTRLLPTGVDSAPTTASRHGAETTVTTMYGKSAQGAPRDSSVIDIPQPCTVLVPVLSVEEVGKADVYNLSVENHHEFFANGILVSNCDAMRYMVAFSDDLAVDMQDESYVEYLGDECAESISLY